MAPLARAWPVDCVMMPCKIATSDPFSILEQMKSAASLAPTSLFVPMKVTPALVPLVSTKTTGTFLALAASTTGARALGSVGARARPAMPLASISSSCPICAWTSDSAGGDMTTTSTPSSLPFASAPACTAAQNGLPAPGPFMSRTTGAAKAADPARPSAAIAAPAIRNFFIYSSHGT